MKKILLINDTGSSDHVGCQAVSDAHNNMLKAKGAKVLYRYFVNDLREFMGRVPTAKDAVYKQIKEVDAVICNGEGTIHHNRGTNLLNVLHAAQKAGKKTFLVNAVFQSMDNIPNMVEVLNNLTDFTVRDTLSHEYLKSIGVTNSRVVVDSIVHANFALNSTCDFNNKTLYTDWHPSRQDVGSAMQEFVSINTGLNFHYIPLDYAGAKKEWQYAVANIRTAKMVITGRHHGVYLAALAGVPFVALPGNTWKIEGTIKASGLDIPICKTTQEIANAYQFAIDNTETFRKFGEWLHKQQPLSTFDKL